MLLAEPSCLRLLGGWSRAFRIFAVGDTNMRHMNTTLNQTVQRTGASRFGLGQINRQRRLAPVADLCVRLINEESNPCSDIGVSSVFLL